MPRPYVICHMCTTIDGKILGNRWGKLPGPKGSADLFETTAASFGVRAWIVGTTTMKEFAGRDQKLARAKTPVPKGDHIANPNAKGFAIGVDAKGVLRFQDNDVEGDHIVLLITDRCGDDYRAHLRAAGVSYFVCGKREVDLHVALEKLRRALGMKKLMLEGGGTFNGSMLIEGLVDEISQVIVPVVDGGGAEVTGLFDYPGEPPTKAAATLRQISHRKLPGGSNWFRFKVRKPR